MHILQAQNLHNRTQSLWEQHQDVFRHHILEGRKGTQGKKKGFALALTTMCTNNVRSFAVIRITSVSEIRAFVCKHRKQECSEIGAPLCEKNAIEMIGMTCWNVLFKCAKFRNCFLKRLWLIFFTNILYTKSHRMFGHQSGKIFTKWKTHSWLGVLTLYLDSRNNRWDPRTKLQQGHHCDPPAFLRMYVSNRNSTLAGPFVHLQSVLSFTSDCTEDQCCFL